MLLKNRHWAIFTVQLVLVVISATVAWLLRFDFTFPRLATFLWALPLLLLIRLLSMECFNLFHGYWRYTCVNDALDIFKAVGLGSLAFMTTERWIAGQESFPISVYAIEAILTTVALVGVRVFSHTLLEETRKHAGGRGSKTVVIVGAGCSAAMLLRELPRSGYTAIALVDDDPAKSGVTLHGVPVRGQIGDLCDVVLKYHPDEIMIAIPSATGEQMQRITDCCDRTGLFFRTIPGLGDIIHGKGAVDQLRDVNLEDLL